MQNQDAMTNQPPFVDTPFDDALILFVLACEKASDGYTFSVMVGPKYTRIVHERWGSKSVYGFVDNANGNVYYPKGWAGPYLKGVGAVRGSIYDSDTWGCCGPYGIRTIR